ncbi:MAG: hypothetical protein KDC24_04805 [Saprospiraceae bacterium]|nr:hypothetical protein [Saprospiraceae bacterium]
MRAYNEIAGMNVENFSDFIKHPANLYRINYQELKGLVLQYPNALNLRMLLLLKSKIENHPDFEKNLQAASTYAIDRSRIFDLLENPDLALDVPASVTVEGGAIAVSLDHQTVANEADSADLEETSQSLDYAWLEQPVENIEAISSTLDEEEAEEKPATSNVKSEVPKAMDDIVFEKYLGHLGNFFSGYIQTIVPDESSAELGEEKPGFEFEIEEEPTISAKQPEQMKNLQKLQKHKGIEDTPEAEDEPSDFEKEEEGVMPLPKESFKSWQNQEENFEIEFDALEQIVFNAVKEEEEKKESHKKVKSEAEILAKRSLKLKTGIVSETLAELLVKQENYEQAIEMYEQLILKYPEKSAFFALQIENLKKL